MSSSSLSTLLNHILHIDQTYSNIYSDDYGQSQKQTVIATPAIPINPFSLALFGENNSNTSKIIEETVDIIEHQSKRTHDEEEHHENETLAKIAITEKIIEDEKIIPKKSRIFQRIWNQPIPIPEKPINFVGDIVKTTAKNPIITVCSTEQFLRIVWIYWFHRNRAGYVVCVPRPKINSGRALAGKSKDRLKSNPIPDYIETAEQRENRALSLISPYTIHINTSRFVDSLAEFRRKIVENPFGDIQTAIINGFYHKLHEILTHTVEFTIIATNKYDEFNLIGTLGQFFELALKQNQPSCADVILNYAYTINVNIMDALNTTDHHHTTINSQIEFYMSYLDGQQLKTIGHLTTINNSIPTIDILREQNKHEFIKTSEIINGILRQSVAKQSPSITFGK